MDEQDPPLTFCRFHLAIATPRLNLIGCGTAGSIMSEKVKITELKPFIETVLDVDQISNENGVKYEKF